MASGKKTKKRAKLNESIRHFFDGDGFDEGIVRVSSHTLIDLVHILGIVPDDWQKETLVRSFRRLWSEADKETCELIHGFFKSNSKIYYGTKSKHEEKSKIVTLDELFEDYEMSDSERYDLQQIFIDVKPKKITPAKIESKLRHLRFEQKRLRIEDTIDASFDYKNRLEFSENLEYEIFEEEFSKSVVLKSETIAYTYLDENSEEDIISALRLKKDELRTKKQSELDRFLLSLENEHHYLSSTQIVQALRQSNGEEVLSPELNDVIFREIFSQQLELIKLYSTPQEIITITRSEFELPFSDEKVNYNLYLSFDKQEATSAIWSGAALNLYPKLEKSRSNTVNGFMLELESLADECGESARLLGLSQSELYNKLYKDLLPLLHDELSITPKLHRSVLFHFNKSIQQDLLKRQRQELLARTIRDFKNLFPQARAMKRQLVLHIGPTNSGKTYQAMQELGAADTGYYLAPLRLLALEGYESLRADGLDASLITGEEQILDEDATHISSTIEMMSYEADVDVCVIDEVQMIDDRDRGWAWANAIIGAPAKRVIMTGSINVKEAIVALAEYLGETLEIIEFERKNPLTLLERPTDIKDIKPNTAVIAFSRKEVLRYKQLLSSQYSVSVVYGNLSPEVRREEARRFREGESEIIVATDAIAMGMNLPIETILFAKGEKFDGEKNRDLVATEVHQISGRAGRYGLHESGYVGALRPDILRSISKTYYQEDKKIKIPFKVSANLEHIKLVGSILEEESLLEILKFFVKNMQFNGPFEAINLESMLDSAAITDRYDIDLATKYHLSCAPVNAKSPYIMASFERYTSALEKDLPVAYLPMEKLNEAAKSAFDLLEVEDRVKEISLYLWLSYRFSENFTDVRKAKSERYRLNHYIESSLKQDHFAPTCRMCNKTLPTDSEYAICQSCFKSNYTHKKHKDRHERGDKKHHRRGRRG